MLVSITIGGGRTESGEERKEKNREWERLAASIAVVKCYCISRVHVPSNKNEPMFMLQYVQYVSK